MWWRKKEPTLPPAEAAEIVRQKYLNFRELLSLNNECLELIAGLQEDLQYVPALRDVVGDRVNAIFERAEGVVGALERLAGARHPTLAAAVADQRREVERHIAERQERPKPRLAVGLAEVGAGDAGEVGGKAAALGEVKNRLGLPVPDGYVLTTEAYRQFCGIPLWEEIRTAMRDVDLGNLDTVKAVAARLAERVMACPVPRAVEVAVTERALKLEKGGLGLAVRSSAVGEGGEHTFAGQFLSLINVPLYEALDAYRRVVAGRFSETALFYRISAGLLEVESPMAVLFLPVVRARAAGILYTRDPRDPKSKELWITATRGLALEIAGGGASADLFVVSRGKPHAVREQTLARKDLEIGVEPGGGLERRRLEPEAASAPSLEAAELQTLAEWGLRIEEHFRAPQDIEWAVDQAGKIWILQARPLALAEPAARAKSKAKGEPLVAGGRPVYPGRASGPACLAEGPQALSRTPQGAVLFLRRASPEIIGIFPRISGLVAEWGNVTGHAAALLREFQIPSVFEMTGVFERVRDGDTVSLDASRPALYAGALWPPRPPRPAREDGYKEREGDPVSRRLLTLHLLDPSSFQFRPSGCKSVHDVLRFCHEKAIEAMFAINDFEMERGAHCSKRLRTPVPLNVYVLDLGGGLAPGDPDREEVEPAEIVSRPFQALWKGMSHPGVSWRREMPARLQDLASVMAGSLYSSEDPMRGLGERSYLLVADEYMNLNSRLAYHFSLVDACLSDTPGNNYISFRFAGGAATRWRRNLRACFIEGCLGHYGFHVDRRGDLVNAWFRKAPAEKTAEHLDILGRLMACASQLDMYMTSDEAMRWYVRQFVEGNYGFGAELPGEQVPSGL